MKAFSELLRRVSLVVLLIGGVGTLASMLLGTAEVIGNQALRVAVPGARELTESTMVLIVFGALAYAQIRRRHIRVELLYLRMGPRVRAAMDVFTDLTALLFFGLLLWQAFNEAQYSWQIGEATDGLIRFPLYPARVILAVGTGLLMLQLMVDGVTDIKRIIDGSELEDQNPLVPDIPLETD
ncbi:MAG: TRAP transporter small permease [Alphaproteobacteria bacterium]|nr:TRAP transporter small permease [Alphaproteobacteria bacterium]